MKPTSCCKDHKSMIFKKERFLGSTNTAVSCLVYSTFFTTLFTLCLLFYPLNITYKAYVIQEHNQTRTLFQHKTINPLTKTLMNPFTDRESCDLFKGTWVRHRRGSLYTNHSCKTIPFQRNCFMHGRKDRDFLHWKWKPYQCEVHRFDPQIFLTILQGKTMAFIGDSLARNQMESLLCLLSMAEIPKEIYKDAEDRFTTWEFKKHNFTLMVLWSQFLITATERVINGSATGSFDLHLDRTDSNWSEKLPGIDYAIFSGAHWFFRQNYLYEHGNLIGCVYCQAPNVTVLGPYFAIRRAFRAAFKELNDCMNCRNIFSILRTYSPSQFENGEWNTGGVCNKTGPVGKEEFINNGPDLDYRKIQMEEVETARIGGKGSGNHVFKVLDVTEIMLMRPDGHPGQHWGNVWMKGYSDCIHWCLPGPIDTWNQLMLEMIKRQNHYSSTHLQM
ncbi:xyloglucan O-acetyltransferase 3-like [Primulina huaijiensis]|uniref:xyloglucan O-acetyltransferase 3-like n=1 Tax=Primulina huaijiensis TaxID=1492673 RepID=UPI003CC783B4